MQIPYRVHIHRSSAHSLKRLQRLAKHPYLYLSGNLGYTGHSEDFYLHYGVSEPISLQTYNNKRNIGQVRLPKGILHTKGDFRKLGGESKYQLCRNIGMGRIPALRTSLQSDSIYFKSIKLYLQD